jgi:hypothetical protein
MHKSVIDVACARIATALIAHNREPERYVNRRCFAGWTVVDYYASQGLPEALNTILNVPGVKLAGDKGSAGEGNRNGMTALHRAAVNGNYLSFKLLLDSGMITNIDETDDGGFTAFTLLLRNIIVSYLTTSDDNVAKIAAASAAFVEVTTNSTTAREGKEDGEESNAEPGKEFVKCMHLLLVRGADVNALDVMGRTAVMLAGQSNHMELLNLIMTTRGDDVNCK